MSTLFIVIIISISAFFFSAQFIPQKKLGEVEHPKLFNITMGFGSLIGCSISFILFSIIFPITFIHIYPIIIALIAGLFWQIGNVFIITSVKEIGMGQTTVLMNLITVFSFLFGILFFQEIPTIFGLLGFFLIIFGALMISLINKGEGEDPKKKNIRGILIMAAGALFISIFNTLSLESMKSAIMPSVPFHVSCFFVAIGIMIGNFLLNVMKPENIKKWWHFEPRVHKMGILSGLAWSIGIVSISYALVLGGLGFGISIVQAFILIFGALWAILYFKEIIDRKNLAIFLIGSIITIAGIVFFSL